MSEANREKRVQGLLPGVASLSTFGHYGGLFLSSCKRPTASIVFKSQLVNGERSLKANALSV